jgi:hypothetical protein
VGGGSAQLAFLAPTRQAASKILRRISTPRQEHQVGRFLGIPKKCLARRAYQRTHGQATSKIRDLNRAFGHRKFGRDFSSSDRVPESTFHYIEPLGLDRRIRLNWLRIRQGMENFRLPGAARPAQSC